MLPFLDHETVLGFGYERAVAALRTALTSGLDVDADPARMRVDVPAGQLLLMPSSGARYAGVKVASVAHAGTPRIKGVYVLMDADTLAPLALLDGPALTTLRTPAVSALAVAEIADDRPGRLVVFGHGPQAHGHVAAMKAVREITDVTMLGRQDSPAPVADADLVCCATTARQPLFEARLVRSHATVVAVGSHELEARELPGALVAGATVVVESVRAALDEAGDVAGAGELVPLAAVVRRTAAVPADRPRVFKSVGMAWEDLVVAAAVHEAWTARAFHSSNKPSP